MFTGLVQHRGRVIESRIAAAGRSLLIDAGGWDHQPAHGESIAVSGCCLTVAGLSPLRFDVIHQTLRVTTLGGLQAGSAVNLEHSVTPATLMGGHLVQGHVDGVGVVRDLADDAEGVRLRIDAPSDLMDYLVPKGSIAVDGVSLTLAEVLDDGFVVALIPTTLQLTTLGLAVPGDRVNLEADLVVKTIVHQMRRMSAKGPAGA